MHPAQAASVQGLAVFGFIQIGLEAVGMGLAAFVFAVNDCQVAGGIIEGIFALYIGTIVLGTIFNYQGTSPHYTRRALLSLLFSAMTVLSVCGSGFFYYYFKVLSDPNVFNLLYNEYGFWTILFIIYHISTMIPFYIYCWKLYGSLLYYHNSGFVLVPLQHFQPQMVETPEEPKVIPEEPKPEPVNIPIYLMN